MLQADTTAYSFDAVDEQPVFHRPYTVYQAIRMLPYNATEEQKDEIVQKYFKPVIVAPSQQPDTLSLPGLKSRALSQKDLPSYKDGFFKGNEYLHPEIKVALNGVSGDPVPYRLRTDVFVTVTLLLSFFVAMLIFARYMYVLQMQLKNFFYNRNRKQIFTLKSDSEMKNQVYIVLLVSFLLTIMFFSYTQENLTSVFNQVSPYKLLIMDMGIFLAYFFCKYTYYAIFNWTFFSSQKRSQWLNAYNFIVLTKALALFPIVLLTVYFELSVVTSFTAVLVALALCEVLVIYKAKQIFFVYKFGIVHLFLYFCTLEMVPLLFLWKMLVVANVYLITFV